MIMATAESLAVEISRRLDDRLKKENDADVAVSGYRQAGAILKDALVEGLEGLIGKGLYRGIDLCSLEANETTVEFSLRDIKREVVLPSFKLTLGDDSYLIEPRINPTTGRITYTVSGRSLFFVCHTLPPRVELMLSQDKGSEFTAHRALEFVGMLLFGKN